MMPGAIAIVFAPAAIVWVVVITNCFGRPREALVSGSTSFTPAMEMISPAFSESPTVQPVVFRENVDTNALPAPGFDCPPPFTVGAEVVKVPTTWVGILVLRKQT